jgi:septal ring factor EnvC (AmiA/AmiB activator)
VLPYWLLLCFFCSSPILAGTAEETEKKIKQLTAQMQSLQKSVEKKQGDQQALQKTLREDERKIAEIASKKREVTLSINNLTGRANALSGDQTRLKQSVEKERALLVSLLQEQYRKGRQPRLKMILSGTEPQTVDRMLRYYDHLSDVLKKRVTNYQTLLGDFDQNRADLSATESQLLSEKQALVEQETRLEQAYRKRLKTLDEIKRNIGSEKNQLTKLEQDRKQLESLLVEIEQSLKDNFVDIDTPQIAKRKGKLDWPVSGKLALKYGSKKSTLSSDGIFISSDSGKAVRVVHPGRVVFSEWLKGYGLLIIVDHGDDYLSLYGHNQSLLRNTGDWVQAGETLSLTGSSGGYDQTGLYFSLRHNGKSFNPVPWLNKKR